MKRREKVELVKLMIGTNEKNRDDLFDRKFKNLQWFSNNLETVANYYEGSVVEITVELISKQEMVYVSNQKELEEEYGPDRDYTYGLYETKIPVGATWYAFSGKYLMDHLNSTKEIFPDLRKFNEE